jgi:uncharacterized membrane protein (DUF2068 family)
VQRERGVVLIIAYKLGKAALWLVLAVLIAVMTGMGLGADLLGLADHLRHHTGAWSLELAELVTRAATRRGLWTMVVALVADALMSLLEGWALWHGHWWGPWLVVLSTGSLLPFEVVAFLRRPHMVRASLFVLNVAIVAYLARKALRERAARKTSVGAGGQ